jgi:hypothetical protein
MSFARGFGDRLAAFVPCLTNPKQGRTRAVTQAEEVGLAGQGQAAKSTGCARCVTRVDELRVGASAKPGPQRGVLQRARQGTSQRRPRVVRATADPGIQAPARSSARLSQAAA